MSRDARIPYAGTGLDRAAGLLQDPAWVAGRAADPRALVRPLWQDQCLVRDGAPLVPPLSTIDGVPPADLVLLGLDGGMPHFAVDLSDLDRDAALAVAGADDTADVRTLFTGLPADEAARFGYARGLLRWHRHQRHCGRCGSPAESRNGGHLRVCRRPECGQLLFPRIEPAVITLVESARPPTRCLLARHRASKAGGYSMLAGFVEIGESLEDAVRREVHEEVGVRLTRVTYAGSQPWPFPAGIMVGFRSVAENDTVTVDGDEIAEARWFTRPQLREYAERTHRLGRPDSIDRVILTDWLEREVTAP
jgi:NAD+ diphosphatase